MVNAARQQLCDEAMAVIRHDLSMPDPEQELWAGMTKKQRIVVLMAAGLSADRQVEPWDAFTTAQHQAMCDQIRAFGRIAARLQRIRWWDWKQY